MQQARIQHVQELILGAFFVREEVNVIDGQEVQSSQLLSEAFQVVFADGSNVFVGELLRGVVPDATELGGSRPHGALQQVGFADAAIAVQEQWRHGGGMLGVFQQSTHGSVGQLVAGPFDEVLKLPVRGHWSGLTAVRRLIGGRAAARLPSGVGRRRGWL